MILGRRPLLCVAAVMVACWGACAGTQRCRADSRAQRRHPLSLDFFDLRVVSMYYLPLNVLDLAKGLQRYDAEPLRQTSNFWRVSGYGHSFFRPYFGLDELADGAEHFFPHQWMVRQAVADDSVVMSHLGQYAAPWWMRNRFPRDIVQWDPYAISGWNGLAAMADTHLSQHGPADRLVVAARCPAGGSGGLAPARLPRG